MESFVLWSLAIVMMFAGTHCISQSQSCTSVNGRMQCTSQKSDDGNAAIAQSGAISNGEGYYQQTSAGTGNTNTGSSSSSQSSSGNLQPGGFPFPGPAPGSFDPFAFAGLPNPFNLFGGGGGGGGGAFAFAGRR